MPTAMTPANLLRTRQRRAGSGRLRQSSKATLPLRNSSCINRFSVRSSLIDDPVVMMPRFIFTSMMTSLAKTMGEVPAGGVNYRAYHDMGRENVEHYKKMGITNPNHLADMAFTFYSQMGWFRIIKMEWNEAAKTKTITLEHTVESEAFGNTG